MDKETLEKRIRKANKEFLGYAGPEPSKEEQPIPVPTDLYQAQRDIVYDYSKKQFPRGSRARVKATVEDVINGVGTDSLAQAYERAKAEKEALDKQGDKVRGQLVANQYMQDRFLPAVEVVANFTSPDELLNSEEALKLLDKYAMGAGAMSGYTAAYIREAYANILGQTPSASSPEVTDGIYKINGYLDTDQMMLARSYAKKLKEKVDKGKTIASEDDYQFLVMIANNWPK